VTCSCTVAGRERPRLFLALVLPADTVRCLRGWQADAFARVPGVRPVAPDNLHITLAFLGARPADDVEPVAALLSGVAAAHDRPALTVAGYRETRSVGMLVLTDDSGRATALAEDLHRGLAGLGVYELEQRPWLPHLTVVRFRRRPQVAPALPDLGPVSPSEAAVYHSVLRPSGAQYEIVESVALGGGS
jgi:2'-5' RNA ligase